ncbi:HD-GYP domain-containing protein [Terrihalobacillus insolitus]|uniref:HD-GYP domain-containing protein n=1 Tax=Terrihalobacillus insolitus TaxID=2950438 RepID=UPI002340FA4C|nr:HD domain-containing phosphohydrolase [Terrihalobacillus insolitus]MDC3412925.1 HD domain-containing protein [Terrihalobacillus insolitus]
MSSKTIIDTVEMVVGDKLAHYSAAHSLLIAMLISDPYTFEHSRRVSQQSKAFAEWLHLESELVTAIYYGSLLHDIGKLAINDRVLNKRGKLSQDEYEYVKTHPLLGEQILRPLQLSETILNIVRHHHERWDGYGYPMKLAEKQIPFEARLVCIIDAFDAMMVKRPYLKRNMTIEKQLQWLQH